MCLLFLSIFELIMRGLYKIFIVLFVFGFANRVNAEGGSKFEYCESCREFVRTEIKGLVFELNNLKLNVSNSSKREMAYFNARRHFKRIEFYTEHVSPLESKYQINGALVIKFDEYDSDKKVEPQGLQLIEELLFSTNNVDTASVINEVNKLNDFMLKADEFYYDLQFSEGLYLDMIQFQLVRMVSLNLNGIDATYTKTNVQEAIWNLESMRDFLAGYGEQYVKSDSQKKVHKSLLHEIRKAEVFLNKNMDFNTFNRLDFITKHVNPINHKIIEFHNALNIEWVDQKKAIDIQYGDLFSFEALNLRFFSIFYNDTVNLDKQAFIGKMLFYDPIMSGNNKRACASCHKPNKNFTDGRPKSLAYNGQESVTRNAPSLVNVIYQKAFFHDGKAYQLEQQIEDVVHSQVEMGGNLDVVANKLKKSETYVQLFKEAFKLEYDKNISVYAIQKVLTEYEKTLLSTNSRFDQYLKGNKKALTKEEKAGYNLFAGKAFCATCHFFPLFNGTPPPYYLDSEYEVLGGSKTSQNKELDPDLGRYGVTGVDFQKNAFKTPSLRNVTLTAPYMHNGAYPDLESVMEFYQNGGGEGFNYHLENQTLPFDSLQLTVEEEQSIIKFMESLTDTTGLNQEPFELPKFERNPEWNNRVWGGEY